MNPIQTQNELPVAPFEQTMFVLQAMPSYLFSDFSSFTKRHRIRCCRYRLASEGVAVIAWDLVAVQAVALAETHWVAS